MEIILSLALTLCALFGFIYGLNRFFSEDDALYSQMIVYGIGCAMLGRAYETLQLLTTGEIHSGFHVGMLGILGSFMFFMAANYGQMDSLVDDGSKEFRKYRLISLAAPIVIGCLYAVYFRLVGWGESAAVNGVLSLIIAQATYFHLKHLIIPDVEDGIIRSIRKYNLMALIYAVLCMAEMIISAVPLPVFVIIPVYLGLCIVLVVFIPVLAEGVKKWTI